MIDLKNRKALFRSSYVRLNERLIIQKGLNDDQITHILKLHELKLAIFYMMEKKEDSEELKSLADRVTQVEYRLQDAWGFPRNIDYHRFWEMPKCTCPKMDNDDAWPSGHYVINFGCPVHGGII